MTEQVRAAIYVRVSTKDQARDGWSLGDQERDGLELIDRTEGWVHAGTFDDGGRKGDREEQLELERLLSEARAGEIDAVVVKALDRMGRDDGEVAATLELLREAGVRVFVGGRELDFDTPEGYLHTDIERIFAAYERRKIRVRTRDGLRARKQSGAPVGRIPLGYTFEEVKVGEKTTTRRIIDPATRPTVERIFDLVESGSTFGDVQRALNAEGIPAPRSGDWTSRKVRRIVRNEAYAGRKGYPKLIEPERFDAIQAGLRRLDPAAVQRRAGGRKPADPSYWLRGTVFCLACGAALYTRRQAVGRVYVCANRRQGTGLCHAEPIPADLIEEHVLDHLEAFVGDAEAWLAHQAQARDDGRLKLLEAAQRLRDDRDRIDQRRERLMDDYEALPKGDPGERPLLDRAARLDTERDELTAKIADAEAVAAEWEGAVDDGLAEAVDLVRALQDADTAKALNAALSRALAGIYAQVNDGRLRAEFELAADLLPDHRAGVHLFQHAEAVGLDARRITLGGPAKPGPTPSSNVVASLTRKAP